MKRHHSLSILWRRGSPCQMQGPPVNRFKQPHNKELRGLCLLPDAQTPLVSPQDPLQQPHLALRIARRYGWTSEGAIGASGGPVDGPEAVLLVQPSPSHQATRGTDPWRREAVPLRSSSPVSVRLGADLVVLAYREGFYGHAKLRS